MVPGARSGAGAAGEGVGRVLDVVAAEGGAGRTRPVARRAPAVLVDDHADHAPRWRPGERFHHLLDARATSAPSTPAVDTGAGVLTAADLVAASHRTARLLRSAGVRPGDRVALVLDDAARALCAMAGVSRLHAAYVPLDASFPADRVAYTCQDAQVRVLLTSRSLLTGDQPLTAPPGVAVVAVEDGDALPGGPLPDEQVGHPVDDLCYVIYTSGTTGRPKGVAVDHAAIVSFVRVASECYGFLPTDRVYQGMTIAFDFSVEESWVPLASGAVLVPRPAGPSLVGDDLRDFLTARGVTAVACVPTLLTTLDSEDLPGLRLLLVSGEACPQDLVTRWHRPGRRMLNVYGPTEATVTATWAVCHPDRPVTLGLPLPTYTAVLLEPGADRLAAPGELGEIGIAGIGLARGYLGRDDLTAAAFVPDVLGLPHNPSGRIYRTGDLGSVAPDGTLAYHGRIDTQVKVRGYRIEVAEVESVLLACPGVAQAVVGTWAPVAGSVELVAWYVEAPGVQTAPAQLREHLARQLPPWMVPGFYERLDRIPMTSSDKADRKSLPAPTGARHDGEAVAPATATEVLLRAALARAAGLPEDAVGVTADLFADLGVTSVVVARFCTRVREAGHPVPVPVREVYRCATLRALAQHLDGLLQRDPDRAPAPGEVGATPVRRPLHARRSRVVRGGAAQLLFALAYAGVLCLVLRWSAAELGRAGVSSAHGPGDALLQVLLLSVLTSLLVTAAPVAVKWLLLGRVREAEAPLWSWLHLRLWAVRAVVRSNPLVLFPGTPVYHAYLRALGVRVGRGALVLSAHVPVACDLVEVGEGAVVSSGAWLLGYRVEAGRVRTGRVRIGAGAFVGRASVLDVATAVGDRAQLAHASALLEGQGVPAGQRWHGSPAQPAPRGADFQRLVAPPVLPARVRVSAVLSVGQLLVVALGPLLLDGAQTWVRGQLDPGTAVGLLPVQAGAAAALLLGGAVVLGGLAVGLLPRAAARFLPPDVVHPVPGARYALHRAVVRLSNNRFLVLLTGDSALATRYVSWAGWKQPGLVQTGSNFGTAHGHEAPWLCTVGPGTMISDGLVVANAEYASSGFRLTAARIGARSFLGNHVVYPGGARTGDDVLLATKVGVPLDGPVRTGTGLLGSPAFAVPRTSDRGVPPVPPTELPERMRRKLRSNLASMALLLAVRWLALAVACAVVLLSLDLADALGPAALAVGVVLVLPTTTAVLVAAERLAVPGGRLVPRACSIYDAQFWRHERMWKLLAPGLAAFDGTPLKPLLLRCLGVRVGRGVYDDGAGISEHTLVELGDGACLGAGSVLQGHSLEDGVFTSDRIRVGAGATVGVGAFVHHGVVIGDGAVVDADSFCLKGSDVAAATRWRGNPAAPA